MFRFLEFAGVTEELLEKDHILPRQHAQHPRIQEAIMCHVGANLVVRRKLLSPSKHQKGVSIEHYMFDEQSHGRTQK